MSDSSGRASVANNNFNSNGTGYTDTGFNTFAVRNRSGVITTMSGATNLVFMPIGNTATANTTNYNSSCAITATTSPVVAAGG